LCLRFAWRGKLKPETEIDKPWKLLEEGR